MQFDDLTTYVWLGGIALQAVLAAVVVVRGAWRKFPFFAGYFVTNLALNCILYTVAMLHADRRVYFYCYWLAQCAVLILGLGAIFEVLAHLFKPYCALRKSAQVVFRCMAVGLVVCGAAVILMHPHGESGKSVLFLVAEEVVRLIEVGIVAFLFLFSGWFGLNWRQSEFGIVLGMGIYAIADLVTVSLRTYYGFQFGRSLNLAIMLSFDFSLLIWMVYLRSPQTATQKAEAPEQDLLEQWNKALTELIYR